MFLIKEKIFFAAFGSHSSVGESTDWNYDLGNSGKCSLFSRAISLANV